MIKYLVSFLLLTSSLIGQTFEDAKREALNNTGVLFIYVSTPNCSPCITAKKVLSAHTELSKHTTIELDLEYARSIPNLTNYRTAPQLILLDVGNVIEEFDKYATCSVTEQSVNLLLSHLPVPLIEECFPSEMREESRQETAARVIKYAIATQYSNGAYNSTFNWAKIDQYLQAIERYWDVDFQRVSRGQTLTFLQANRNISNDARIAAVAGGGTIKIAPRFNFGNSSWCGVVTVHETGHIYGGSAHNRTNTDGLMGPTGGFKILQSDYYWFRSFKFRNVPRPHEEPDWFIQWVNQVRSDEPINTSEIKFICPE